MIGFSLGTKGYFGLGSSFKGGSNITFFKDFWEYDPQSNTWTKKADFQGQARTMAINFVISTMGYIGAGGTADAQNLQDFWKFTP
jgi:N-acetylneuraminic acid mutarotase